MTSLFFLKFLKVEKCTKLAHLGFLSARLAVISLISIIFGKILIYHIFATKNNTLKTEANCSKISVDNLLEIQAFHNFRICSSKMNIFRGFFLNKIEMYNSTSFCEFELGNFFGLLIIKSW